MLSKRFEVNESKVLNWPLTSLALNPSVGSWTNKSNPLRTDLLLNLSVPHTTAHVHELSGVHSLISWGWYGNKKGGYHNMRLVNIWYAWSVYSYQLIWSYEAWGGNVCIADIDYSQANSPGCAPGPQPSNKQEEVITINNLAHCCWGLNSGFVILKNILVGTILCWFHSCGLLQLYAYIK